MEMPQILLPSLQTAKQTETTQRFKIHLVTKDGRDLLTKVEFSRRGFWGETQFARVEENLLRDYRMASVVMQHYTAASAFEQKIQALVGRSAVQARDAFDLFHLIPFLPQDFHSKHPTKILNEATRRLEEISFENYRFLASLKTVKFRYRRIYEMGSNVNLLPHTGYKSPHFF